MAGYEDGPKTKAFTFMAEARAKEKKIPFRMALMEIARENPELADDYRREVLKGNPSGRPGGSDPESTIRRLVEWAKRRGMERQISFKVALAEIVHENPELYHAYREAVTRKFI